MKQLNIDITKFNNLTELISIYDSYSPFYEKHMIKLLPDILNCASDTKLSNDYNLLLNLFLENLNTASFQLISTQLYSSFTSLKYQTKISALNILIKIAQKDPKIISYNLPKIIEELILIANDVKKDVKDNANKALIAVCETIDNVDVKHIIPVIIDAYMNPVQKTEFALDKLVKTPFVNDIDIPTLALLIPLLVRSMKEKKVSNQRKAAVVMETMCKLIKNPVYVKMFYDKLMFILNKGIDEIAIEEVRNVCAKSKETINKVYHQSMEKKMLNYNDLSELFLKTSSEIDMENSDIGYASEIVIKLIDNEINDNELYYKSIFPYISFLNDIDNEIKNKTVNKIVEKIIESVKVEEYNPEDCEENLCDCMFSLAYGTRVLLHQTPFKVKVGRKYGLVGPNGAGKSTLMKAIANKNLQGFPEELTSIYVEHDIQGNNSDISVLTYVKEDEKIKTKNLDENAIIKSLTDIGFEDNLINGPVTSLSGGWRMKLALSKALLLDPDMLLLDEPTNHLDQFAVKWLIGYLTHLTSTTCLIVSHDTKFLDAVCTNIIHYEQLKLKIYRGNLSEFVKQKPEAIQYYELTNANLSFDFPEPGPLEGVKSLTKAVLKMKNTNFQYKTSTKPQLIDVSLQVSLASRVAICGVNGAGKSTLIKILVGELEPDSGFIERHPNVRIAYVAQHAFHHIENHLEKSPVEYIMWRYRGGIDKEQVGKDTLQMTAEEIEAIRLKAKNNEGIVITEITARRTGKREHEYEVVNEKYPEVKQWFTRSELYEMGYQKMVQEFDEKHALENMANQRKLTTGEIQKHFDCFGLEPHFAQHSKIGMLSGGQLMRCVLAGCTWNLPHIIILDEPTNFLDRDSVGALAGAIKGFKGGILIISHNAEFYENLCPERWLLEGGRMTTMGSEWMEEVEKARKKAEKENAKKLNFDEAEDKYDALGNKIEVVKEKKELTRGDKKKLLKQKKEMEKAGLDTYEIDILLEGL